MAALEVAGKEERGANGENREYKEYLLSPRWRKLRRAVMLRAKGQCEICRRYEGVDCAHLTYERVFHEHMEDLLWVCKRCHRELDAPDPSPSP